jgi:ATPase subunit of ABC transporter with duplicated ATPase domains
VIISVDSVTKTFGERVLFEGASLRVGARDRVALLGPNGAGKTTLLEIISGEQTPDEGTVTLAKDAVVGYLRQEAIEMHGRTVLAEALTAAADVTTLEHRLHLLEARSPTLPRTVKSRRPRSVSLPSTAAPGPFRACRRLHARIRGARRAHRTRLQGE